MTAAYLIALLAALASVVWMWWVRERRLPKEWMVPNLPLDSGRDLAQERRRIANWCRALPGLTHMASMAYCALLGFTVDRMVSHRPLPSAAAPWIWSGFCLIIGFLGLRTRKRFISLYERVNAIVKSRELPPVA